MNLEGEEWIPIMEFEHKYQISNRLRIKSIDTIDSLGRLQKSTIIKPLLDFTGYMCVNLYKKDGGVKRLTIHRLVARHFIPNPENKKFINHKNGDRTDYSIENLEWCTASENIKHGYDFGKIKTPITAKGGANHSTARPVIRISPDGTEKYYDFMKSAAKELCVQGASISACCRGDLDAAYGYTWRYADERKTRSSRQDNPIIQICQDGTEVYWIKLKYATSDLNVRSKDIVRVCKGFLQTTGGFGWKFVEIQN